MFWPDWRAPARKRCGVIRLTSFGALSLFTVAVSLSAGGAVPADGAVPAAVELEATATALGSCTLTGPAGDQRAGGSRSAELSAHFRTRIGASHWYSAVGFQSDDYRFDRGVDGVSHLQDYAGVLAIEYFEGAEQGATVTLQPGIYSDGAASSAAWDIPVEVVSGIPLPQGWNGVVGFSNGRFYHHPLPIFGLVWKVSETVRIDALYPEPALHVTLSPETELRIGGTLDGGGFLVRSPHGRTPLEYSSYDVGAEVSRRFGSRAKLTAGVGAELIRSFDFFRLGARLHGGGAGYVRVRVAWSR